MMMNPPINPAITPMILAVKVVSVVILGEGLDVSLVEDIEGIGVLPVDVIDEGVDVSLIEDIEGIEVLPDVSLVEVVVSSFVLKSKPTLIQRRAGNIYNLCRISLLRTLIIEL